MSRQPTESELQIGYGKCFICGKKNPIGLAVDFYRVGDEVRTEFTPRDEHQGYPGFMHGGIVSALLDETIGRAGYLHKLWTMTARLELRYRKSIPIGDHITCAGRIVRMRGRLIECEGEARLSDGTVAVEARGTYMRIPDDQLEGFMDSIFGDDNDITGESS